MESAPKPSAVAMERQRIEMVLEKLTNMETTMASLSADIASSIKYFCVQAGKGGCVYKVDAWTAACSGPAADAAACAVAEAALHKCISDPSTRRDSEQPQPQRNSS
ncbi:hypothetical protein ZWY2020_055228 [Hordeum vulgare]|nr:hypothetical protein ZWY2020_055228 [Hordeum vulgare]